MKQKGRNELLSTLKENNESSPLYLDSAYKQLLRQDHKMTALQNRTKLLNLNHGHILRQAELKQCQVLRLEEIKGGHSQDVQKLRRDKEKKTEKMEQQKDQNNRQRERHLKQMSSASVEKHEQVGSIKQSALKLRNENSRLIELSREGELQKKREVRNKIHKGLMESRVTIQQFFVDKHASIVDSNNEEIRRINQQRITKEAASMHESGNHVAVMERDIRELKKSVKEGRDIVARPAKHQATLGFREEETHPLLKRIDNVMSRYTKLS